MCGENLKVMGKKKEKEEEEEVGRRVRRGEGKRIEKIVPEIEECVNK